MKGSQYFAVADATTGEIKRYGTCSTDDVELQASEPNEIAFVCPPEVQAAVRMASAKGEAAPYVAEVIGDITVISPSGDPE